MTDDAPESLIPYDEIVQEALRAVVGRVLHEIERTGGLPGGHHFYITFKTQMLGVSIPKHLAERFPDEMTIVIQHRYWDLKVEDDLFSVGLSFGGIPSTLVIPFAAVTDFVDPAVDFSLNFQANGAGQEHEEHDEPENDRPVIEPVDDGSNAPVPDRPRAPVTDPPNGPDGDGSKEPAADGSNGPVPNRSRGPVAAGSKGPPVDRSMGPVANRSAPEPAVAACSAGGAEPVTGAANGWVMGG